MLLPIVYLTVHGYFAQYTDDSSCCDRRVYPDLIWLGGLVLGVPENGADS